MVVMAGGVPREVAEVVVQVAVVVGVVSVARLTKPSYGEAGMGHYAPSFSVAVVRDDQEASYAALHTFARTRDTLPCPGD